MEFVKDQKLSAYSSMQLGGKAKYLCHAKKQSDFLEALNFAKSKNLKIITIGHGTNIIFTDSGLNGLVVVNEYSGYNIEDEILTAKSGSSWDEIVQASVENDLVGIEALSLVPGTVGGAPVNNIGAYGQEIKDTLVYVKALNNVSGEIITISNAECDFGYRNSIFKEKDHGKFQILEVCLKLKKYQKSIYRVPNYPAVQQAMKNELNPNPSLVRKVISEIRRSKLPDPTTTPNTGSFFKNPIVDDDLFNTFINNYPDAPYYELENNQYKIPAGWLIENLGLKGKIISGIEIYKKQALVLVNRSATSYKQLDDTIKYIQKQVKSEYNIAISIEPEIIRND